MGAAQRRDVCHRAQAGLPPNLEIRAPDHALPSTNFESAEMVPLTHCCMMGAASRIPRNSTLGMKALGSVYCNHCGSSDFRPSRFRKLDLLHLLIFRFPVRCRDCSERLFVNARQFALIRRETEARRRRRAHSQSSQA